MATEKQWSKDTFKRAAKRHYQNCQYIFSIIPSINDANYKNHVISDCYYIGGYVMECALKFFVMSKNHMTKCYQKNELSDQRLLTHNLSQLISIATEGSETLEVDWKNLCKLTKDWSEEVRYDNSLNNIEAEEVSGSFKSDMEKIFKTVFKQY